MTHTHRPLAVVLFVSLLKALRSLAVRKQKLFTLGSLGIFHTYWTYNLLDQSFIYPRCSGFLGHTLIHVLQAQMTHVGWPVSSGDGGHTCCTSLPWPQATAWPQGLPFFVPNGLFLQVLCIQLCLCRCVWAHRFLYILFHVVTPVWASSESPRMSN